MTATRMTGLPVSVVMFLGFILQQQLKGMICVCGEDLLIWRFEKDDDAVAKLQMHGVLSLPAVGLVVVVVYSERSAQFWGTRVLQVLRNGAVVFFKQGLGIQPSYTTG